MMVHTKLTGDIGKLKVRCYYLPTRLLRIFHLNTSFSRVLGAPVPVQHGAMVVYTSSLAMLTIILAVMNSP